nr:HAD family hydrolase [Sphingobium lactosutens]
MVVFDMDGTLYDQSRLQRHMMAALARDALRRRSLCTIRTLSAFRKQRESMADMPVEDFDAAQYRLPGRAPEQVRMMVADWMERRPLPLLRRYRAAGVGQLFERLARRHVVAIYSDYPPSEKLAALGLSAALTVGANDVGRLKPDPSGLLLLMERAHVAPARTLMIGDRDDRDGEAARRAGVRALIRGRDFRHFDEPIFRHVA